MPIRRSVTVAALLCTFMAPNGGATEVVHNEAEAVEIVEVLEQSVGSPSGDPLVRLPELLNAEIGLILSNGDELRGTLIDVQPGWVLLAHASLGEMRIERQALSRVRTLGPTAPSAASSDPGAEAEIKSGVTPPEEPSSAQPDRLPEPPRAKWSGRLQLGLSGSRGSNDSDAVRIVASAKRDGADSILSLRSTYQQTRRDGDRTENRFTARARNEWLRGESMWSGFMESEIETAEFLDYNARLRGGAGAVYRFLDNDETLFSTRLGLGAAREFGSSNDEIDPEAIIALAFSHRFSERQRLELSADYFPDLRDTENYRADFRAGWEIGLNAENNMKLRLSLEDRYDSRASMDKNNIDYFAELVYEF